MNETTTSANTDNEVILRPSHCPNCDDSHIVKYGTYKGVQRWWCKSCKRKFKADGTLFHMKTPAKQVSSAMSMYYEGMSIKAITRQLKQDHNNAPSTATIYEWIQKYTQYAIDSARGYHPKVGDRCIADETVLQIDGQNIWFWDIIDEKTRFLLASHISTTRTTKDAQGLMEQAATRAGKTPKVVITDSLSAYLDGVELAFGRDSEHRQGSPFAVEDDTQRIERFHGTLKARTKVMRGLKNLESALEFTDGWLVHYNYLRPHESLSDKTPAEVAGVAYPYKNWAEVTRHKPKGRIIVGHTPRGTGHLPETKVSRARRRRQKQRPVVQIEQEGIIKAPKMPSAHSVPFMSGRMPKITIREAMPRPKAHLPHPWRRGRLIP